MLGRIAIYALTCVAVLLNSCIVHDTDMTTATTGAPVPPLITEFAILSPAHIPGDSSRDFLARIDQDDRAIEVFLPAEIDRTTLKVRTLLLPGAEIIMPLNIQRGVDIEQPVSLVVRGYDADSHAIDRSYRVTVRHAPKENDVVFIYTEADLRQIGRDAVSLGARYRIMNDIMLTGDHDPMGNFSTPFTGLLEGNNRRIGNLRIDRMSDGDVSNDDYLGLFAVIGFPDNKLQYKPTANGEVRDLTIELASDALSPSVDGASYVAALVGVNYGLVDDVRVYMGTVRGGSQVGGLVGINFGTVQNSTVTTSIRGGSFVGGIAGVNEYSVTGSVAMGAISGTQYVGGLVGDNKASVTASHSEGTVSGLASSGGVNPAIGGLVGRNSVGGRVEKSYSTATVEGNERVGGLVGENAAVVRESYTTGLVSGGSTGSSIGGMVGQNSVGGRIEESYSTATVEGNERVGGAVGYNAGDIVSSYAIGAVVEITAAQSASSSTTVGSFVGTNLQGTTVTNNYVADLGSASTMPVVGVNFSGGVTALLSSELKDDGRAPFASAGWNFPPWQAMGNNRWPVFTWQESP